MFNHNHDYIEKFRQVLYPKLHPYLKKFGGYGVGTVSETQYVASLPADEELIEEVLWNYGWQRNIIASYKTHEDGRDSEGSWRLRGVDDDYGIATNPDKQLHITLFNNTENPDHIDVYCHYEYDWTRKPLKHLREVEFNEDLGSRKGLRFIRDHTYLEWYDKNE